MTHDEVAGALRKIEGTTDLLERALLLAGLVSVSPQRHAESRMCAKKLMAACLSGRTPVDWGHVERLALDPRYAVLDEVREMRREVERELGAR